MNKHVCTLNPPQSAYDVSVNPSRPACRHWRGKATLMPLCYEEDETRIDGSEIQHTCSECYFCHEAKE